MLAIINPGAGGGKALARWQRLESPLHRIVGPIDVLVTESPKQLQAAVPELLAAGHRDFLVAGGDGSVNTLLAALVEHADPARLAELRVGAVGLGSSNDFHKPYRRTIDGIPCRVDFARARAHDIGRLDFEDPQGEAQHRFWFVNASIGVAAEANRAFNHPGPLLRLLKRVAPPLAIAYAAVRAVLRNHARDFQLTLGGRARAHEPMRNLGFVKNPHFAGSLRYDSPHLPDSGCFHVHRLGALSLPGLLRALARLARGRFADTRGARSWLVREAAVRNGGDPFLVECDGEVVEARQARFSILSAKVRLCS